MTGDFRIITSPCQVMGAWWIWGKVRWQQISALRLLCCVVQYCPALRLCEVTVRFLSRKTVLIHTMLSLHRSGLLSLAECAFNRSSSPRPFPLHLMRNRAFLPKGPHERVWQWRDTAKYSHKHTYRPIHCIFTHRSASLHTEENTHKHRGWKKRNWRHPHDRIYRPSELKNAPKQQAVVEKKWTNSTWQEMQMNGVRH